MTRIEFPQLNDSWQNVVHVNDCEKNQLNRNVSDEKVHNLICKTVRWDIAIRICNTEWITTLLKKWNSDVTEQIDHVVMSNPWTRNR